MMNLKIKVNGINYKLQVDDSKRLLDILRDDLNLTGTKEGCGIGECGACTVIMNGDAVNSCLVLAIQAQSAEIETVENLEKDKTLSRLQMGLSTEKYFKENRPVIKQWINSGFFQGFRFRLASSV